MKRILLSIVCVSSLGASLLWAVVPDAEKSVSGLSGRPQCPSTRRIYFEWPMCQKECEEACIAVDLYGQPLTPETS